jgi:D-alanyl-D-alanine carboxypeptidase
MSLFRTFRLVLPALALNVLVTATSAAAQAYLIADSQTGYILEEREGKQKRQVGSLTKVAAAMVALDWAESRKGDLNQVATIPPEAFVGTENNIGFQPGDSITLRDLLYAALVQSDNIAAFALANHVGLALESLVPAPAGAKMTPVAAYVAQMNVLARQLRMERTRFFNPHGMDQNEKPIPYSTAIDMAKLTQYALKKASFRFYVSQKQRQIAFTRGGQQMKYLLRNTNELLGSNGIDGVKTGRTARAGDCLILSAHREAELIKEGESTTVIPRHLIIVLLGSPDRFGEGTQLVSRGWQLYDQWAAAGRLVDPKKVL